MSVSDGEKEAEKIEREWRQHSQWTKILDCRVTNFSDGRSCDLKEWLDNFSRTLHRCHIPPEKSMGIIPFYLSGPALLKFNRLDETKMKDWETTAKMLIEAHDCPAEKEVALQELTTISQGEKNLSDFGQHIRTLGNYAYDGLTKENKEQLMATHFLAGTSKKIRSRLGTLHKIPKTLTEMQAEAEKIERLLQIEEEEDEEDDLIARVNQLNLQRSQNTRPYEGWREGNHFHEESRGYGRENFQNNLNWSQPDQGNQEYFQNSWNENPYDDQSSSENNWNDNFQNQGNQWNSGNGQTQSQGNRELRFSPTTGRPYIVNSVSRFLLGVSTILALMTVIPAAKAANESNINFIGTCSATLKIGNISVPHTWLVSTDQECPAQMLIGSDLIMKLNQLGHGININLHEKETKIGDSLIWINPNPQSFFLNTARGPSFVEGKGCRGLETRDQEILNTKKQTLSSQDDFSTSRGRRTRKAPASVQEASKGPNPKRRRLIESSELEGVDIRESRPKRKSATHANHNESDADLDEFKERTKRTMSNQKSQFSRLAQNDNRKERVRMRIKVTFTDEQTQLLLAVFQENRYPSLDQQGSGGR